MPEYLHPGVYVEETSFRAKPIEGVSTSTAGLVGRTRKGPEGRPMLVTSFTQFVREFGAPYPVPDQLGDYLGHAMRAFFENGGRRAYVVRALAADALRSDSSTFVGSGTVLRLPRTATVIGPTDILPLDSLRNVDTSKTIEIWTRSPGAPPALRFTFGVLHYDPTRNTVQLSGTIPTGTVLNPASTFVVVQGVAPATPPGPAAGPTFNARYRGAGGDDLAVEVIPTDTPPTRLATHRFQRNRPIVASFAGTGPTGAGTNTFQLAANEARQLRVGDQFAFPSGAIRTITEIDAGTLAVAPALSGGPWGFDAVVSLLQRGATPAPSPIPLYKLTTSEQLVDGASNPCPHGVAASVIVGDQIRVAGGGGPSVDTTVVAGTTVAASATITFTPALGGGEDFSTSTVRLVTTAAVGTTTRLVVGDTTGLVVPYRDSTAEPIAVTAGGAVDASTVRLVDPGTNQVFVTRTDPPAPGSGTFPDTADNSTWSSFETLQVVGIGSSILPVATTAGFYTGAIVEVDDGTTKLYRVVTATDPGNRTITVATIPGPIDVPADPAARRAYVRVLEMSINVYETDLATGRPILKEQFERLTWNSDPAAQSLSRYYVDKVNDPELGSKLVTVDPPAIPPPTTASGQPTTADGFLAYLTAGSDGSPLTPVDLIGSDNGPNQRFGIQSLVERNDIALVAVPGVTDELVQQALITHCELLRYRFAVLDGRPNQSTVTDILAHRNNYDTKYAGYYAPWLTTVDLTTGRTLPIPPSGYVLGICARVDNERGVHKAPANETVRGILDVELPFTDGEQDVLNPVGVNLSREFEGRGIRVWGARTLSSDSEWKYVNVRRLFIFLEHSIDRGTQWVVFEPNNEALWARVKATIEAFLFGVWKTGALMGTKPEEAYFVRCDRTTMTQDDLDNGRLVCLIGVAPTYPAEFVVFRIGQFTASSNLA